MRKATYIIAVSAYTCLRPWMQPRVHRTEEATHSSLPALVPSPQKEGLCLSGNRGVFYQFCQYILNLEIVNDHIKSNQGCIDVSFSQTV